MHCFAPSCNHRHPSECKFYTMPTKEKDLKMWIKYLACRTDTKPNKNSRVCSCHFKDGLKENGPTIFSHNINKRMKFQCADISVNTRRRQNNLPSTYSKYESDTVESTSSSSCTTKTDNVDENMLQRKTPIYPTVKESFSFNQISDRTDLIQLYTGLPNKDTFSSLLEYLTSFQFSYYLGWRVTGILPEDQLLITLMKLRLNSPHLDLSTRFNTSCTTITNIFLTWVLLIHRTIFLTVMSKLPSKAKIRSCLPSSFSSFTNCRLIIDCTEVKIAIPKDMRMKNETYSHYKHAHTYKILVGVTPNGVIAFASNMFPGSTSDKQIFLLSKLNDFLEPGDMILADKGFLIHDVLKPGVTLNIPPFLMTHQFSKNECIKTMEIARARIVVERANARIKHFRILNSIPGTLKNVSTAICQTICALVNLQNPLCKIIGEEND